MRNVLVSTLAILSLLLMVSAPSATPLAPDYTRVGVKLGDSAIYRISDSIYPYNKTRIVVHGILGPVVTLNRTFYNPDGSIWGQSQIPTDLITGIGLGIMLIAANLTTNDPIHSGDTIAVNETIQIVVTGALRTVNHANYYGGHLDGYWDKATGLVTELRWSPGGHWMNYTLLSTTAWAPDTVPSLLNMTTIVLVEGVVIVVLVIALIVLATRPRRR
jgi:hypothetical protein